MTDKYQALLAKLKEATGPFEWSDAIKTAHAIYPMLDQESGLLSRFDLLVTALTSSLAATGAALALVDRELPENTWKLGSGSKSRQAPPPWFSIDAPTYHEASAPTLPLAILIAWCEAMIQKEISK